MILILEIRWYRTKISTSQMLWTALWFFKKNSVNEFWYIVDGTLWHYVSVLLISTVIKNRIIPSNYLLIQNIPATWEFVTDNNFHYSNTYTQLHSLTSEVDLELQLIVINFLSLVTLTSTMYLQKEIICNEGMLNHKSSDFFCVLFYMHKKTTTVGSSKDPWKNLTFNIN